MANPAQWEFRVKRLGLHKRMHRVRTYGSYEVFKNGETQASTDPLLKGFVCETIGPGKNHPAENGLRIEQGRYQLTTQFGKYVSINYSTDTHISAKPHMPGIALMSGNVPTGTGERVGILIHPDTLHMRVTIRRWPTFRASAASILHAP